MHYLSEPVRPEQADQNVREWVAAEVDVGGASITAVDAFNRFDYAYNHDARHWERVGGALVVRLTLSAQTGADTLPVRTYEIDGDSRHGLSEDLITVLGKQAIINQDRGFTIMRQIFPGNTPR